ncbi:GTPase-associated protein 1-related protein [Saccharopolyspora sp. TS4A08]|uniref:GTPase-associated protein 1-related protein n=1 Tax=Saccharopolyspora ipomoeae TaxID=3042027 RepID=A0ABT6PS96_9PSEU|nr:GTPase-associated protein 1-related protein [Saccharopolyspora sp. TS4A08]MDI2030889.1 GTPase-associated protein 1-related protein [Saccharopolyspora sp. TS4A08]
MSGGIPAQPEPPSADEPPRAAPETRRWVPRVLTPDSVEVVDSIELADEFARARGEQHAGPADRLAAGVIVLGEGLATEDCALLAAWLRSAPADVRGPVLSAVLAADPPREVLADLAAEHAGSARMALLRREIAGIVAGGRVPESPLTPHPWGADEAEEARSLLSAAADEVAPDRVDLLLRTATRFGADLPPHRFTAERFVSWWASHPEAALDPSLWPCADELVALLRATLVARLEHSETVLAAVTEHWWPLLRHIATDPFEPLDAAVLSAAVRAKGDTRRETIDLFAERMRDPDLPDSPEAVLAALFGAASPTVDELHRLIGALPATAVTESIAQRAFAVLDKAKVTGRYLDLLRVLGHHLSSDLRELWSEDARVRSWIAAFGRDSEVGSLSGISDRVLRARLPEVVTALLAADPRAAARAIGRAGPNLQQLLLRELPAIFGDAQAEESRRDGAVALAFVLAWSDGATTEMRTSYDRELERWVRSGRRADHRRVSKLLRSSAADHAAAWHEWLQEIVRTPAEPDRGTRKWWRRRR